MAARKTVRKGIAKVPVMIQLETLECGAVSLAMCLRIMACICLLSRCARNAVFPAMGPIKKHLPGGEKIRPRPARLSF